MYSSTTGGGVPVIDDPRAAFSQLRDALGKLKRGDESAGFWHGDVWFEFTRRDIDALTREVTGIKAHMNGKASA